eukprot:2723394-Prymnesium_polylepis.1
MLAGLAAGQRGSPVVEPGQFCPQRPEPAGYCGAERYPAFAKRICAVRCAGLCCGKRARSLSQL